MIIGLYTHGHPPVEQCNDMDFWVATDPSGKVLYTLMWDGQKTDFVTIPADVCCGTDWDYQEPTDIVPIPGTPQPDPERHQGPPITSPNSASSSAPDAASTGAERSKRQKTDSTE